MADVWKRTQASGESVEEFVAKMLKLFDQAGVTDDQMKVACLTNNLLPSIRCHVIQKEARTVEEILRYAKVAEQATREDSDGPILYAVGRLEKKVDALSLQSPESANPPQDEGIRSKSFDQRESGSQSPSAEFQPRNQNNRRAASPYVRERTNDVGSSNGRWYNRNAKEKPFQRVRFGDQGDDARRRESNTKQDGGFRSSSIWSRNQAPSTAQSPPATAGRYSCFRCGSENPNHRCGARDLRCFNCGKTGHKSRVCFSSRRGGKQ